MTEIDITHDMRRAGIRVLETYSLSGEPGGLVTQIYTAMAFAALKTPAQAASPELVTLQEVNRKVDCIMAQLDDLMAALGRIGSSVDEVGTDVSALVDKLNTIQGQTPPEVDLSGAISAANAIADKLSGIKSAADAVVAPPAAPAPEGTEAAPPAAPVTDTSTDNGAAS